MMNAVTLLVAWVAIAVPASLLAARWMRGCAAANGETPGE